MSFVLNYVANPVRNYVSSLFVSALSKYIIGIEVNSLGILSQELNLQNVELNLSSLEEDLGLKLPLVIKSSFAKSLKIVIPWTSLLSLPIGIYIDNLDICLEDKSLYDAVAQQLNKTEGSVEESFDKPPSLEHVAPADSNASQPSSSRGMWGDSYLKRIIANVSLRIDNLIVRYNHDDIHCVLTSKYVEIMSGGPEDQWEYSWQEPRGVKGSIYKCINISDFSISMDCMREKPLKSTNYTNSTSSSFSDEKTTELDMERERVFYHPIVSNVCIHVRCMLSLWEGAINAVMSQQQTGVIEETPEKQLRKKRERDTEEERTAWNLFGLLSDTKVDEIQEHFMHITKDKSPENPENINFGVHNMQTIYDISYYTNVVDIHVDNDVAIAINTYQLNAVINLLNLLVGDESADVMGADSNSSNESLPEGSDIADVEKGVIEGTSTKNHSTGHSAPISSKFNVNAVSLSIGTILFTYYIPGHLLPSSYQRPGVDAIPYLGEDKSKNDREASKRSRCDLSMYIVPKSHLKTLVEVGISQVEAVMNVYDNRFYDTDILFTLREMHASILDKPVIQWNVPTSAVTPSPQSHVNHICMFGGRPFLGDAAEHTRGLQHQNAMYVRMKAFSSVYHDYLIDHRPAGKEIVPAGCVELFINNFHLSKDKSFISVLELISRHTLRLKKSKYIETPIVSSPSISHNDYFVQLGVKDISCSYQTPMPCDSTQNPFISTPSVASVIALSLSNVDMIFYNNLRCLCCPQDTNEFILNASLRGLSISCDVKPLIIVDSLSLLSLNSNTHFSFSCMCDNAEIHLNTQSINVFLCSANELIQFMEEPALPYINTIRSCEFSCKDFFSSADIAKTNSVILTTSEMHIKTLLHSLSLAVDDNCLLSYPAPSSTLDRLTNAFELLVDYAKTDTTRKNRWTCSSAALFIDANKLFLAVQKIVAFGRRVSESREGRVLSPHMPLPQPVEEIEYDLPPFLEYDLDIRALMTRTHVVNVIVSPWVIVLNKELRMVTPTINVVNNNCSANEMNAIVKGLRVERCDVMQCVVDVKDMYAVVNMSEYFVHISSQLITTYITSQNLIAFKHITDYYSDLFHYLQEDIAAIDASIKQAEVVTDESIFLRSSVDHSQSVDDSGFRRRRNSISHVVAHARGEHSMDEPKMRIANKFKLSYALDKCQISLDVTDQHRKDGSNGGVLLFTVEDVSVIVDKEEICCSVKSALFGRIVDCAVDSILSSDTQAISASVRFGEAPDVSLTVSNFKAHFMANPMIYLVEDTLAAVILLTGDVAEKSEKIMEKKSKRESEMMRLSVTFCLDHTEVVFLNSQQKSYQLKVISCKMKYDQYTSNTQFVSILLQNVFIASESGRLLLNDFSMQCDAEIARYRCGRSLSLQLSLPHTEFAVVLDDFSNAVILLDDILTVLSIMTKQDDKTASKTVAHPCKDDCISVKVHMKMFQYFMTCSLHTMSFQLDNIRLNFDSQQTDTNCRLLAIGSLSGEVNRVCFLSLQTLQEEGVSDYVCVCLDRIVKEKEKEKRKWFYLNIGDLYFNLSSELLDILLLLSSFYEPFQLSLSSHRSLSTDLTDDSGLAPSEIPLSLSKDGISIVSRSIQMRITVPGVASMLLGCRSAKGMLSTTVLHCDLEGCCVLMDNGRCDPVPDLFNSGKGSYQSNVLDECSLSVNVDSNFVGKNGEQLLMTKHVTVDVKDVLITADDVLVLRTASIISAFSPIITSILQLLQPKSVPSCPVSQEHLVLSMADSDVPPEDDPKPEGPYQFPTSEEATELEHLPDIFLLSPLDVVFQDIWPENNQLVVIPVVMSLDASEEEKSKIVVYPALDYYGIINGVPPVALTTKDLHTQLRENIAQTAPKSSLFSLFSSSAPTAPTVPHVVGMQFRFASIVRLFSVAVRNVSSSDMDAIAGPGFAALFGESLEFDVLAWSEVNRSFTCIKSICVPVVSRHVTVSATPSSRSRGMSNASDRSRVGYSLSGFDKELSSIDSGDNESDVGSINESIGLTATATEFFEMAAPYSYSNRYKLRIYLHGYRPGEMTTLGGMMGVVRGVAEIVKAVVFFQYFISL